MVVSAGAQKWINNACSSTVTGQLKLITNGSLTVKPTAAVVIRERVRCPLLCAVTKRRVRAGNARVIRVLAFLFIKFEIGCVLFGRLI